MSHGVTITEVNSAVKPASRTGAGPAVYVGTAPINAGDLTFVNTPMVAYTLAEALAKLGAIVPSSAWGDWTLCEAIKAHFSVYSTGPVVFINVIDPDNAAHVSQLVKSPCVLNDDDEATVEAYSNNLADETKLLGVIESTVQVRTTLSGSAKTLGTDYTLEFDSDGYMVITRVSGGGISAGATLYVSCDYLDPSGVTADDIIGGYDTPTGAYTGLEVVEQVFPQLRLVPGKLLAPTWSQTPSVAARIGTIARAINGMWKATPIVDLSDDSGEISVHSSAPTWKSDNGYNDNALIPCFGKVQNGDDVYCGSTVVACIMGQVDAENSGVPAESPSNKTITGDAMLHDGVEVNLTQAQANTLNDNGIVTFLNGPNGWTVWGNRNGEYPGNTDVKDSMIPVRRMIDHVENVLVSTVWSDVDSPGNLRQVQTVKGTVNAYIDGQVAAGNLAAGSKCEFRADENPATQVADGHYVFHLTLAPFSPMETIEFTVEYDATLLTAALAA